MKLSNVFLLFFFLGIIFVGVVNDILAYTVDTDSPYSVVVDGYRYGGVDDRLHVNLFACAECTTVFGVNGEYELQHIIGGNYIKRRTQRDKFLASELDPVWGYIDGEFYDYISTLSHFEEDACQTNAFSSSVLHYHKWVYLQRIQMILLLLAKHMSTDLSQIHPFIGWVGM